VGDKLLLTAGFKEMRPRGWVAVIQGGGCQAGARFGGEILIESANDASEST